jgi:hypothetical protein
MSANAARIELTPEEIAERKALFRRLDREFGKGATVIPLDHPSQTRRPLGLRPAADPANTEDDDDPAKDWQGFHFSEGKDETFLAGAVSFAWLFYYLNIIGGVLLSLHNDIVKEINTSLWNDIKRKFREVEAERRVEVSELKVVIAELRAEVSALRSVQESQRIQSRGEMGLPGPRGVPGSQGPIGPAGPQGPRGDAAATIVSWEPAPERFELTPILGDGTRGVSAHLLPFFEQYDASIRDNEEG